MNSLSLVSLVTGPTLPEARLRRRGYISVGPIADHGKQCGENAVQKVSKYQA